MTMNINDTINYGNAKFKIVKNATSNDIDLINNKINSIDKNRKNSTTYSVGDVVFCSSLPSSLVLECTIAGTTSSTEPSFSGAEENNTITDGTVIWTYRGLLSGSGGNLNIVELSQSEYNQLSQSEKKDTSKIYLITDANPSDTNQTNGVPLGAIVPYVAETQNPPAGFLFCDGSAVSRLIYSDLFGAIGITYGTGDGSTTFNLPDLTGGEFLEGSDTAGTSHEAGLPNIEGSFLPGSDVDAGFGLNSISNGAFSYNQLSGTGNFLTNGGGGQIRGSLDFDASDSNAIYGNSDTVQPKSLTVRYLIKYLPNVIDSEISAADAASQAKAAAQAAEAYAGSAGIPIGTLFPFAANTQDPPTGYLFCDGSAVSRTMYPDLFSVLGTTWGDGDGSTTFNLPRSEDLVLQGASSTNPVGTYKEAGLPNITGSTVAHADSASSKPAPTGAFYTGGTATVSTYGSDASRGKQMFDASRCSAIYGASDTVQPPAACVKFIIKAYDGVTPGSAGIDLSQYASELGNKASRGLDNLTDAGEDHFLGDDNFCIIYPNGGTAANPANIAVNNIYLETNPFPNYHIATILQIFYNSKWFETGWVYSSSNGSSYGTRVEECNGQIRIVTGNQSLTRGRSNNGTDDDLGSSSAPCRVKVWKIGKIQS